MRTRKTSWEPNKNIPMGRGATFQQFVATVGADTLEIDVAPWGEEHLRVNGQEIAQVKDRKDRRQAFRDLKQVAERYLQGQALERQPKGNAK
jgi:enoyl-[acyl-carrier protein] reductase I